MAPDEFGLTPEDREAVVKALESLDRLIDEHQDCTWEQIGRCVYCADHNDPRGRAIKLYQGRIPPSHTKVKKTAKQTGVSDKGLRDSAAMRERWRM